MAQSWIFGFPGYEGKCFVHVRASTLANKGSYTFSLMRYPKSKDPSKPFPGRSILDLGFSLLEGRVFFYSLETFKACFDYEVRKTPMVESMRSLLESYKGQSTPHDLITSNIFVLTRAFINDTLCTFPMVEELFSFVSQFFATHLMSPMMLQDTQVFLCIQAIFFLEEVMPRKMIEMIRGNPLRYWRVGGEMMEDLQTSLKSVRLKGDPAFASFRLESAVSYKEKFTVQVDTLSLDEVMTTDRPIPIR